MLALRLPLAVAVPANSEPAEFIQPDGTIIKLHLRGDEYLRRQMEMVECLAQKAQAQKETAKQMAYEKGWQIKVSKGHRVYELMRVIDDRPIYYQTCNVNSAISQGTDLIRNTIPYNLNGAGLTVGIWDGADVRDSHQEFDSRVTLFDAVGSHSHSTHVGGTIGAAGVDSAALGMAPSVNIDSYDWNSDESEMTSRAASYPAEPDKIYVSNHSYGIASGWENGDYSGNDGPHWFGVWGQREDESFGQYAHGAPEYDSICYSAPYYLPFWAAGNDRNDSAPTDGTTFYYYFVGNWESKTYDSSSDPYDDYYDGGFDTILPGSSAKNVMTIGAVNDAVLAGLRSPANGTMTTFSGWGPTDDGRIKPDIVCNGVNLYSSTATNDSSYASYSGTSMAAPSASGAAALLVEYWEQLFSGQAMRASTLKGLIIHTADDLGNPGPDYSYGWGLMNAKVAADCIKWQYEQPYLERIVEGVLNLANTSDSYSFTWDGSSPIRATLCWTDPPADEVSGLDDTSPCLINDLDLRIIDPNGFTVYYPFILDPTNPSDNATTGNNMLDNVEQVCIDLPLNQGVYTASVTYKGTLTDGEQNYSIIITGQEDLVPMDHFEWDPISTQYVNVPFEVVITAKDAVGQTAIDFTGVVDLSAVIGSDGNEIEIGAGTTDSEYPISVYYKKRRTQTLYLSSEIDQSGTITDLALYVTEIPALVRSDWTIRMQHTTDSVFSSKNWVGSGWTTVYQSAELPGTTGWQYYHFTTPFDYNDACNLMIDFSFDNSDLDQPRGYSYQTATATRRSVAYKTDSTSYGPPTTWSGPTPPGTRYEWVPNIRLQMADTTQQIQITPMTTTNFIDGIWAGQITFLETAADVYLNADDANGHSGDSNNFDVIDCTLPSVDSPDPINNGTNIPVDKLLSWSLASGSGCETTYDIYFDTINQPATLLCDDISETSCDPVLSCSTTYYWQVIATNCCGTAPGPVWSFTTESLTGDFDLNCITDYNDLSQIADNWLFSQPAVDIAPPGGDGIINLKDLAAFAEYWLIQMTE